MNQVETAPFNKKKGPGLRRALPISFRPELLANRTKGSEELQQVRRGHRTVLVQVSRAGVLQVEGARTIIRSSGRIVVLSIGIGTSRAVVKRTIRQVGDVRSRVEVARASDGAAADAVVATG